jgi:hypothetical protein
MKERIADMLEDEAIRRGCHGVERPVLHMGKQVMLGEEGNLQPLFEREYSDALLIMMLKALRPEKYRDRSNVKVEWDGDLSKLTDAQLAKMDEQGREQLAEQERQAKLKAAAPASEQTVDVKAEEREDSE